MKKKILIVDDIYPNRYLLEEILEDYEVFSVPNGDRMREFLISNLPDLILMDVNLPDQDGFELTRGLKSGPRTKNIPVIFLTVHNTKADVIRAMKAGGADFITKPYNEQDIKNRVEKVLKENRLSEV